MQDQVLSSRHKKNRAHLINQMGSQINIGIKMIIVFENLYLTYLSRCTGWN